MITYVFYLTQLSFNKTIHIPNYWLKKYLFTVIILVLPILFSLLNVCSKQDLRRKPREYLAAICNQVVVPYLGLQAIRNPNDEKVKEQYWRLKVSQLNIKVH